MVEIFDLSQGAPAIAPAAPLSLALGNFDGVHLGHRALLEEAKRAADGIGGLCAVWTFDRNPSGAPEISSPDEKAELFAELGVRYLIRCSFDEVRSIEPEAFVRDILIARLGVKVAVCGFNHRFGHRGSGDPSLLVREMERAGGRCVTVGAVDFEGDAVSSSRIREALANGDMRRANAMLARPFRLRAEVTHGNEIGRTLGFPTINQRFDPRGAVLRLGVYATRCMGYPSVSNVGTRPTVTDSREIVCETHIIGFDGRLYGDTVTVEFLDFLRPERKFESLDALRDQLRLDIEKAIK